MSKSIRYMSDKGFLKLVSEIKEKFKLEVNKTSNNTFIHLGIENKNLVFANLSEKKIVPSILAYKIFYDKNNVRTKTLSIEGFEEVQTKKTLLRKLENTKKILEEYEKA